LGLQDDYDIEEEILIKSKEFYAIKKFGNKTA